MPSKYLYFLVIKLESYNFIKNIKKIIPVNILKCIKLNSIYNLK